MAMSLWPHFFGPRRAAGNAVSATLSDDVVITQLLSLIKSAAGDELEQSAGALDN